MGGDDRLHDALAELTRQREDEAPDFERLLEERPRSSGPWIWAAAATIILALFAGIVLDRSAPDDRQLYAQLESVSEWRAATDVFLPGDDGVLYGGVPPLGQTGLDIYAGPASRTSNLNEEERP